MIQSLSNFCSGLFNKFGELIKEHGPHGDIDFASRINLDLYMDNSKVCKRGKLILKLFRVRVNPNNSRKIRVLKYLYYLKELTDHV